MMFDYNACFKLLVAAVGPVRGVSQRRQSLQYTALFAVAATVAAIPVTLESVGDPVGPSSGSGPYGVYVTPEH